MDVLLPRLLNILIVDDNEDDALLIARRIRKGGHDLTFERVDTADGMRAALRGRTWDIVISDVNMPGFSAAGALAVHKENGGDCPFIVVSGVIGEETAVSLLKDGAHDFILKNNMARLVPAIERELRDWEGRRARAEAEKARRISEERYALAARGANDGLWDWDLTADRVYYSGRWREMLGLADEEIGDRPGEWFSRIHPEETDLLRANLDAHLAGASPHFAVEHRIRHRDGSWRWVLARGLAVCNATGKPYRIAGSLTDITASKLAEQTLRKAKEDLENALAAKSRFLAAASHDLRQPFQSMRLYQHMLSERVADPIDRQMVTYLGEAMAAGEGLLNALLDVSTLDAGVIQVHRKDFCALDAARTVAREFEQTAAARGIRLRVIGADDAIDSDPTLFGRMLRNLISNAVRYTPDGGRILVACRRRRQALVVEVWDTGIGIPLDMQEAIFEDFVQVGNPERDRRNGLGLGLAIVRRTARLLDCGLSLRSQPGKGAMFALTFQRVEAPAGVNVVRLSKAKAAAAAKHQDALHVLVIEDDELQLQALKLMLEVWGFSVTAASSAEDAFATLAELPVLPGMIVSDFRLPGEFNGVQTVARICNEARLHIPAIIVTGDTAPERIKEATATGCRLIHKPYDPSDLRAAIHAMAGAEAGQSPTAASSLWGEG